MRIALLGPLDVRGDDGAPVEVAGGRLRTLLARLALESGRLVTTDALIDAVWSDEPPAGASNALQSLVSRLRRVLPAGVRVESLPAGYRLSAPPATVDVAEFEALCAEGRAARDSGDDGTAARCFARALSLWRGEPLSDIGATRFAEAAAARLTELRLRTIEDSAPDLASLAELVAAHPLRERLRALHMRALWTAGRTAEALESFEDGRRLLADRLGADPSEELRSLHTAILRGPSPRPAGNLRAPVTSFVGRADDLARVASRLDTARLVTLVGPGGVGKTRLATEVVRSLDTEAWLVELAGVRDEVEVPATILAALGLRDAALLGGGPHSPVDRLVERLRGRSVLLVLDNCEHLLGACARVAEALLGGCAGVRILATTREPLAIAGEVLCPVGPLAGSPSLELFADRAVAVRPGFALTDDNVGTVTDICRRLDGLPLAIELACARLRTLPLDELAARLGDRFRLLTGGSRTAMPRHQTLQAVVAWSWDLLTDVERTLARRVAVFAGGATLSSVEEVCAGDVVGVLGSLVDKSFVELVESPPRYRMLDTIRAFAAGALAESGEADRVRAAHAAHFLAAAERAEPALRTGEQLVWLGWLRREYDNLAGALRWAVDAGDAGTAVRLAVAMGWFWLLRGSTAEAATWLREVLALPRPSDVPSETLAVAYAYDAIHHFSAQNLERAVASAKTARTLVDDEAPAAHPAVAMVTVVIQLQTLDFASAMAGLASLVDHPDPWVAATGWLVRGHGVEGSGDATAAYSHFGAARDAYAAVGDRWGTMMALSALANLSSLAGDHSATIDRLAEAERLAEEVGAEDDAVWTRARLALERLRAGDVARARRDLERARAEGLARSRPTLIALTEAWLSDVSRIAGDLSAARSFATSGLRRLDGASGALPPRIRIMCLVALARSSSDGDVLREALDLAVSIGDRTMIASVSEALAALSVESDPGRGATLLGLAAAARGTADRGSADVRALASAARSALGSQEYDAVYGKAAALTPDEAVAALTP